MTYTLPVISSKAASPSAASRWTISEFWWSLVGAALVAFLWLFTHYTRVGLALRGMAQDERAALMLGIDSDVHGRGGHGDGLHAGGLCRHSAAARWATSWWNPGIMC